MAESKKYDGVIFLKDWKVLVFSLAPEHQLVFWDLFTDYEYGKVQICENKFVFPVWNFITSQLDDMKKEYNDKIVLRNKTNGAKGGRPKKPNITQANPKNPVGYLKNQHNPENPVGFSITQPNPNEDDNGNEDDNNFLLEKETKVYEPIFESEDVCKNQNEEERKKVAPKKESLEMPEEFFPIWQDWIDYRKARKLKPYAGAKYEQIAVNKLLELSNKDPVTAKKILEQTYQNNYQGFFELKENYGKSIISTGTNANNTSSRQATFNIREASERLAADFEKGNILGVYKK